MGTFSGELFLAGGDIRIRADDIHFPSQFGYGRNEDLLKVFTMAWTKFLEDSPLQSTVGPKPKSLLIGFFRRLTSFPLRDTIVEFSKYADEILKSDHYPCIEASTRPFLLAMKNTPIFKEYHTWWRTGDPALLRYIISFCRFGKKLEYDDPYMDEVALQKWQEVEVRLNGLVLDPDLCDELRTVISVLLPPLVVDGLYPKTGTGAVSESGVRTIYDKLGSLKWNRRLAYAFWRPRPGRSEEHGFGWALSGLGLSWDFESRSSDVSRTKFVPKDITKSRTISMIPNTFMIFEQEVMRWMVQSIDAGLISRFVNLRDQRNSQEAALLGSCNYGTDTLDLSSASDSVHIDLVKRVFPNDWLFYMLATRISKTRINGKGPVIETKKYAPMGSATCFPTQCIIFTGVAILGAMRARAKEGHWYNPLSRDAVERFIKREFHASRSTETAHTEKYEPPVVYGDDIAIDGRSTDSVVDILTSLGFEVNISKSFTGSQMFRESCGIFAYNGEDVTPCTFRIPLFVGNLDAKTYASWIASINNFGDFGYRAVATFLLQGLKSFGFKTELPFTLDPNKFGIFTRNKHVNPVIRRNADLQIDEELVLGLKPRTLDQPQPGNLEFYRWVQRCRSRRSRTLTSLQYEDLCMRERVTLGDLGVSDPFAHYLRKQLIRPQETRIAPIWARCE